MYNFNIVFEYNPLKAEGNLQKHGISFEDAKALWDTLGVEREVPSRGERRWIRIGLLKGKAYTCVFTLREEKVRIISARRSRIEEENLYQTRIKNEKEN